MPATNSQALVSQAFTKNDGDLSHIITIKIEIESDGVVNACLVPSPTSEISLITTTLNQMPDNDDMEYLYSFATVDTCLEQINWLNHQQLLSTSFTQFLCHNIASLAYEAQKLEQENLINALPTLTRTLTSIIDCPTRSLFREFSQRNLAAYQQARTPSWFFATQTDQLMDEYNPADFGPDVIKTLDLLLPPAASVNSNRLDQLAISANEIPSEIFCCISNFVMTDPVYFPKLSQHVYERCVIEHILSLNPSDPFTRQARTVENLVLHTELKTNIEFFLQQAELKNNNQQNQYEAAKQRFADNLNNAMTP